LIIFILSSFAIVGLSADNFDEITFATISIGEEYKLIERLKHIGDVE
jgi:hypothetical protein